MLGGNTNSGLITRIPAHTLLRAEWLLLRLRRMRLCQRQHILAQLRNRLGSGIRHVAPGCQCLGKEQQVHAAIVPVRLLRACGLAKRCSSGHSQAVSGTRTIQRGNIARPPGVARCSDVVPDSRAPRWSAIVAATLLLPLEDIESRCTNVCVARWYANKLQCEPPASSANGLLLTGTRTTSEVRATCSSDEARSSPSAEAQHIGDKLSAFTLHRMCGRPGHQPSYTQTMLAPGCRNATLRSCLRPCTRYLHDTVHAHMNRAQRQLQAACKASAYQGHASP